MGSGSSRPRSGPSHRTRPQHRRRPTIKRAISSLLVCGSPSTSRQMEDYSPELLVRSAENSHQDKLKFPRKYSSLPLGCRDDLNSSKSGSVVSPGRCLAANENRSVETGASNVEPDTKGKWLSESRELVPSHEPSHNSRCNETASTSYVDQPSPYRVDMSGKDATNGKRDNSSQIGEGLNNHHGLGERFTDEASLENNVSEEVDFSNSDFSNSYVSDSDFHVPRDDNSQGVTPSALGFLVSEREPNRQDGNLLHVDVVSISPTPNVLPNNSSEISSREARRNSRRLFWDAFSRRNSRRHTDSRNFIFSPGDSDLLRPHDRWLLDFSGGLLNDEIGGDYRSNGSRTPGSNEQRWNSRSEIWERLRGGLDSTDLPTAVCPRGIHSDGSCSCHSSSSTEESGARAGISRIVMLAEALFEVLDQIHQQPMSLSLSMVSVPAPESVVDSFPVKTHRKTERSESADEVSQCYICLSEYEEGDKIRVLPCQHEYHMSCVDKWLKEIHGVCPLCRGDVREGSTEGSTSN